MAKLLANGVEAFAEPFYNALASVPTKCVELLETRS